MTGVIDTLCNLLARGPRSQPPIIPIHVHLPDEEYIFEHPIAEILSLNSLCTAARHQCRDGNFVKGYVVWAPRKHPERTFHREFENFTQFGYAMEEPGWDGIDTHHQWVTSIHITLDWGKYGKKPEWRGWNWATCWEEAKLWELDERIQRCIDNRIAGKSEYAEGAPEVEKARLEVEEEAREWEAARPAREAEQQRKTEERRVKAEERRRKAEEKEKVDRIEAEVRRKLWEEGRPARHAERRRRAEDKATFEAEEGRRQFEAGRQAERSRMAKQKAKEDNIASVKTV
ncbi:hypothetical protein EDC01DRAFT_732330 [Geopyxis carbonaria]|nr:hypothetical protein EDC01DRAFT_732330 [Geopyxis carbonaria]